MSKYNSQSTMKSERVRLVLIIERGLKRAMLTQSIKYGCKVRPDTGSLNQIGCKYIMDGLRRDGVNVDEIIKSGL